MARLDERTEQMSQRMNQLVTRDEFAPVKMVIYGMVGIILVGVITGLLTLVLLG